MILAFTSTDMLVLKFTDYMHGYTCRRYSAVQTCPVQRNFIGHFRRGQGLSLWV